MHVVFVKRNTQIIEQECFLYHEMALAKYEEFCDRYDQKYYTIKVEPLHEEKKI